MLLKDLTPVLINRAIRLYLERAYPDPALRRKQAIEYPAGLSMAAVLADFETERTTPAAYYKRLGSQHYPHMKLGLVEAYFSDEFIFSVDRHDGFDPEMSPEAYEQWQGVRSLNFQTKADIERAWYDADLPTLRRLREERLTVTDVIRAFSGHTVLLVDNDADSGAIMQMILTGAGYGCVWAAGVRETERLLAEPSGRSKYGLAIVDVMLNDGNGLEVVKLIRRRVETQEMPIILTSAMSGSDVLVQDVDFYLRKPFSAESLVKLVAESLRQRYDGRDLLGEKRKKK